jgi:hypothetical protein
MHEWALFGKPARISFVRKHNSSYCSHGIPLLTAEKAITFRLITYCTKLSEFLHYTEDRRIGSEGSSLSHSRNTLNFSILRHQVQISLATPWKHTGGTQNSTHTYSDTGWRLVANVTPLWPKETTEPVSTSRIGMSPAPTTNRKADRRTRTTVIIVTTLFTTLVSQVHVSLTF